MFFFKKKKLNTVDTEQVPENDILPPAQTTEWLEPVEVAAGNTLLIPVPKDKKVSAACQIGSTENPYVALSKCGYVIGLSEGSTVISTRCRDEQMDIEYKCKVNVITGKIRIEAEAVEVERGKEITLTARISKGVFTEVNYTSSNPEMATVVTEGVYGIVKGKSYGKTVITMEALVGEARFERTIEIKVRPEQLPFANPVNSRCYKPEDKWQGDYVYFGDIEQDGNLVNGREPILWRVLEVKEKTILLLSEYGLASRNFVDLYGPVTWETSTLRRWLNTDFIRQAFNGAESDCILNVTLKNEPNEEWKTNGGADTVDKVFLLTAEDVVNPEYGFYKKWNSESETRTVRLTPHALARGGYTSAKNGNTCWWLRTMGFDEHYASYVLTAGKGTYTYFVGKRIDAVRPALYIDRSKIDIFYNPETDKYCRLAAQPKPVETGKNMLQ